MGCVHGAGETLCGSDIDVPSMFWQLVVAQNGSEVRALAVVIEQDVPWKAWPARYIASIDELEEMTGLDLLSALPDGEEAALEAKTPSRLWPVRITDIAKQLKNHIPARDSTPPTGVPFCIILSVFQKLLCADKPYVRPSVRRPDVR